MEQRDSTPGLGICGFRLCPLVGVAPQARQGQIRLVGLAMIGLRNNMVGGQVHCLGVLRQLAILAAKACSRRDKSIQPLTDPSHA